MHHKSLFLLINPSKSWDFRFGLEHFVMWGGTSSDEEIGEMPTKLTDYFRVIFGLQGGEDSPLSDQENKAGNQLGAYQFEFRRRFTDLNLSVYLNHPFENHPGIEWRNWPDNLIGIHIDLKDKTKFLSDVVYEFTYTKHQNLGDADSLYVLLEEYQIWKRLLIEPYFNHGIYRSGFTYDNRVIGSPLFFPVMNETDNSESDDYGIRSNRFVAHHMGLKGNLSEHIQWKGLFTYVQHFGTFEEPYEQTQKQFSSLLEFQYTNINFPVEIGLSCAFDTGNSIDTNTGVSLSLIKRW
jgi:hypothetical protein